MTPGGIRAEPLQGIGEVRPGDDLAALVSAAAGERLAANVVVVIAHKVVSKAEGRIVRVAEVQPSERARELAAAHGRDPRQIQVVLDEAAELVRERPGALICRTRHGYVCANAGVDASNAPEPGTLVLLPVDPDASARALRARLPGRPAVVISDSFGRAWRQGQADVAIGIAGLAALDDWSGRRDAAGRELLATSLAIADQAASAADLARAKDSREPAVLVYGLERHISADDGPGAAALVRPLAEDLFK